MCISCFVETFFSHKFLSSSGLHGTYILDRLISSYNIQVLLIYFEHCLHKRAERQDKEGKMRKQIPSQTPLHYRMMIISIYRF